MEYWEVLDSEGNPTGEIMEKYDKKVFEKGYYHLGADVWIINNDNKILIQKRSPQKRLDPNVWAMTGGSVILGENSLTTIVREKQKRNLVNNEQFIGHRWEFVGKLLKEEIEKMEKENIGQERYGI